MKSAIFSLVILALAVTGFVIFSGLTSSPQRLAWEVDYSKALTRAQEENKPMILFFTGSDWCVWCNRLEKEVFESGDFLKNAGESYIFVKLDFPMNKQQDAQLAKQNHQLQEKYSIEGFPTLIVLDSKGSYVGVANYEAGGGRKYAKLLESLVAHPIAQK